MPAASGAEETDQAREAAAYNASIYLMVGVPYLSLACVGFWVYRGLKRKAAADAAARQRFAAEGGAAWPVLSPAEVSSPEPFKPGP